jgi:proteasome assembly chaperone (PAC2) family protein
MAYRKKTLRTMSPTARKVARLMGEQVSIALRLKNLIPDLQRLDLDSRALETAKSSGLVLSDTDAWGLESALIHGQQDGYFDDNKEWAEAMLQRLRKFRDKEGKVEPKDWSDLKIFLG